MYDINRLSIIYTAKLKFYQGNFYLNITDFSYVECSPNWFELNMQPQFSHVARDEQTVTGNLEQPAVSPNNKNIVQGNIIIIFIGILQTINCFYKTC